MLIQTEGSDRIVNGGDEEKYEQWFPEPDYD